jgi:hypothetical protein
VVSGSSASNDFAVRSGPRSTHILNGVSPGWTTSLAMAVEIATGIEWE